MYPNPQDVLPLPPRPSVAHYRKRAKALVRAAEDGAAAIGVWAAQWMDALLRLQADPRPPAPRDVERLAQQLTAFAAERMTRAQGALSQAQFVVARAHGFASWPKFVRHLEALEREASDRSIFERGADAVIAGDLSSLDALLVEHPGLVRARSDREHHATLLHYVSANGVENYRQRTPANIVAVAQRLLDAGAEVDAEADVYGGGATTLGLVVTSAHPRAAGVQLQLADTLLARGARLDRGMVRGCLMNGCPEAATHLASLGIPLSLDEAAGIGRIDAVASGLKAAQEAGSPEVADALLAAAWYDQREVVTLLLDHGVDVALPSPDGGDTALHVAAYLGNAALVGLLLERHAPVNVIDQRFGTPPLVWALHAWLVEGRGDAANYRDVLLHLAEAGAIVRSDWIDDDRVREDRALHAALVRRMAGAQPDG